MANPPPSVRWAVFAVLALLALLVRLPQLGARPMHTDEAVNAYITGQMLAGEPFRYDPRDRHGPALFMLAEPVARLGGARNFSQLTENKLRLTPVLLGALTVGAFGFAVEAFGFVTCLFAAALFAFAPLPVYYNRYFIHETLFVLATLGLFINGWKVWKTNSLLAASFVGGCAALLLACKETAAIHFFAMAFAGLFIWKFLGAEGEAILKRHRNALLVVLTVFVVAIPVLFSWFGQNWSGLRDLFAAIPRFTARAGGEGHQKSFWYYFLLLSGGWSGALIALLGAIGWLRAVLRKPSSSVSARLFLAFYAVFILGLYSVIPYKTPWLALNFWLPLALLAGFAIEWLWLRSGKLFSRITVALMIAAAFALMTHDTWDRAFARPADESNPYAYAHTGEDLLRLPDRIEELALADGLKQPVIAVVADDPWPLPWYLRRWTNVGFWQPGNEPAQANYFITTTEVSDALATRLKDFRPEFFGLRPNVLLMLWSPPKAESKHE